MRRYSRLAIVVSHISSDDALTPENDVVRLTNGNTAVEVSDFENALHMLPPGSEVAVVAQGTVGNTTVHNISRIIRESNVFVTLDLSAVTELSRVFESSFQENPQLLAMHFPSNLLSINPHAFAGCSALSSVIIPASVMQIGAQAFGGCLQLHHLEFKNPIGWKHDGKAVEELVSPFENPAKFVFEDSPFFNCELTR